MRGPMHETESPEGGTGRPPDDAGTHAMAALGIEPELVEEAVAAAVAGMPVGDFRTECHIPALNVGQSRLYPLDDVRVWAKWYWRKTTGGSPAPYGWDGEAPPPQETLVVGVAWPELMTRETAAAYLDMSPLQFDRNCPVPAVDLCMRAYRWKKPKLDAWVASLAERDRKPSDEPAANDEDDADTPEARRAAVLARVRKNSMGKKS